MPKMLALVVAVFVLSCGQKEDASVLSQTSVHSLSTVNSEQSQLLPDMLATPTPFPGPEPSQLLNELNMARKLRGLPELTVNESLVCAASRHAWDIGPRNVCSSKGSDGSELPERIRACRGAATVELIGCNYASAKDAVDAWVRRPDLSRYILNYNMMQVGVAEVNRHYVAVFLGML